MEEIGLAVSRLAGALGADEAATIARACSEARLAYRRIVDLYPKLQLDPAQRDSLIAQLSLLSSRIDECEQRAKRAAAVGGES